jgi:hypothetical protein
MLKKITTPTEQLWVLHNACVSIKSGKPAKVRHISNYERRWRIDQARLCNNPVEVPSDIERKVFWIAFGPQLRAVGGIK